SCSGWDSRDSWGERDTGPPGAMPTRAPRHPRPPSKAPRMDRIARGFGYCRCVARTYGGQAPQSGSLFDEAEEEAAAAAAPLAVRVRPRTLDEGIGQQHP